MSLPGRPKGEYRSVQRGGCLMSLPGRSKGEHRSAQRGGCLMSPPGRHGPVGATSWPLGEYRSAQHEGTPVRRRAVPKPVLSLVEGANTAVRSTEVA